MKVIQRLITIVTAFSLLFSSTSGDVLVQPGYAQPTTVHHSYNGATSNLKPVTSRLKHSTLEDEFHRYQILQRLIEDQIVQLVNQQQVQTDQPNLGLHLPHLIRPLRPHIADGRLFSLNPHGIHGLHLGGYGVQRPVLLRDAAGYPHQLSYAGRTQWPRSVSGGPELDSGSTTVLQDVAPEPSVEESQVEGVVEFPEPEINAAEDSIDKLVEPRHVDDGIVGSPLDGIHYAQPHHYDQHHPIDSSGIPSNVMKTAHTVGKMIDTVASSVMDSRPGYENKDPMMSHRQNPAGNYQHHSQYQQPSHEGQRSGAPTNWNAAGTSSNNRGMTGQPYNSQPGQYFGWNGLAPYLGSQNPTPKADNHRYFQQAPASNTAANNKNWLSIARQFYNGLPSFQNYPPGYPNYQPGYPNYYGHPPNQNFGPPYPNTAMSSATASATSSSSGNSNMGYPPYSPAYKNPYTSYNPQNVAGVVDQFGRSLTSLIAQPQNANAFVQDLLQNHVPAMYRLGYAY